MTYCIYQIINTINGKLYIGQTNNIKRRWHEHVATSFNLRKLRQPLHKAIVKYGVDAFEFRIIQEVYSFSEAMLCEMYWILYYKSNMIRFGNEFGYNLSDGGEGAGSGPKSKSHKENIGKSNKGKIRTVDMRLRLSEAKSSLTKDELAKIKQLLFDNVSTYEIARMLHLTQSVISDIKLGKTHRYFFTDEDIIAFGKRKRDLTGEKNGGAKLNERQVKEIKALLKDGLTSAAISKRYGVGKSTVLRIKNGESWAHII